MMSEAEVFSSVGQQGNAAEGLHQVVVGHRPENTPLGHHLVVVVARDLGRTAVEQDIGLLYDLVERGPIGVDRTRKARKVGVVTVELSGRRTFVAGHVHVRTEVLEHVGGEDRTVTGVEVYDELLLPLLGVVVFGRHDRRVVNIEEIVASAEPECQGAAKDGYVFLELFHGSVSD